MKKRDLAKLSTAELVVFLASKKKEMARRRIAASSGATAAVADMWKIRKNIARAATFLTQKGGQ